MFQPDEVLSYLEMCRAEGVNLQRGMNYRLNGNRSVLLMSRRPGAPYSDRVEGEGQVLIYEGHDAPRTADGPDPKTIDQPDRTPGGGPTENARFFQAAMRFKQGSPPEHVRVYEKVRAGIWTYNGIFRLLDAWREPSGARQVFKFKLELDGSTVDETSDRERQLEHPRLIPTAVKLAVWKRDGGKCVRCGSLNNLHFDHVIPHSRGGSSLVVENVQLLCARHNLAKHDRIE